MTEEQGVRLRELEDEAIACDWKVGFATGKEMLSLYRKFPSRGTPEMVELVASRVMSSGKSALGDEYWTVAEQRAEALIALRDFRNALALLKELKTQFPTSSRVERLILMHDESLLATKHGSDAEGALEAQYEKSTEDHEGARGLSQRRVAIARTRGLRQVSGARPSRKEAHVAFLAALKDHLRVHTDDVAGWTEYGHALMQVGRFAEAAFCFEELILLQRGNPHFHCRLAECLASIPKAPLERLEAAERHAASAVKLSHGLLPRALLVQDAVAAQAEALRSGGKKRGGGHGEGAGAGGDVVTSASATSTALRERAKTAATSLYEPILAEDPHHAAATTFIATFGK